jgi:hypothetical protein
VVVCFVVQHRARARAVTARRRTANTLSLAARRNNRSHPSAGGMVWRSQAMIDLLAALVARLRRTTPPTGFQAAAP